MDDNNDISLHLDAVTAIKELLDSSQSLQGKLLASRAFVNGERYHANGLPLAFPAIAVCINHA